ALNTFDQHREGELSSLSALPAPTVAFSATLNPWTPGAVEPDAKYVRVSAPSFTMTVWLARVLPGVGTTQNVGGAAVSGPIPLDTTPPSNLCDLVPMMMCPEPENVGDDDCSDGTCYGYQVGGEQELCLKAGSDKNGKCPPGTIGSGNFQLLELDCPGADCLREALAGGSQCVDVGDTVETKTGNNVGPVFQGLNTRFDIYAGGGPDINDSNYPPDTVVHYDGDGTNDFWHDDYYSYSPPDIVPKDQGGRGVPERRELAVPIGNCTGTSNGSGPVPVVGIGCFFLTKPAGHNGKQMVFGQFIGACKAYGSITSGPPPGGGPTLYKIVLYKDPINQDS
ncbi:MAG: hypothetical protein ACREV4_03225, partial [Gammaproteobacteria bacterium]